MDRAVGLGAVWAVPEVAICRREGINGADGDEQPYHWAALEAWISRDSATRQLPREAIGPETEPPLHD